MCKHPILQSVVSRKRKSWSHKQKFQKIALRGKKEQTEKTIMARPEERELTKREHGQLNQQSTDGSLQLKESKKPSISCIKNSSDFKTIPLESAQSNKNYNFFCGETMQSFPHVNKFTQKREIKCAVLSAPPSTMPHSPFYSMCLCHNCTSDSNTKPSAFHHLIIGFILLQTHFRK